MNLIKFFIISFPVALSFFIFSVDVRAEDLLINNNNNNKQDFVNKNINVKNLTSSVFNPTFNSFIFLKKNQENELPASELYEESWNTNFLKAYSNITVPDSFSIDVSGFVVPISGKVTSPYGFRKNHFHYGIDIKLKEGDTIRAAFDGKVRVMKFDHKGYGYFLVLRHYNGLETVYGHLSKFLVTQNGNVKAGQPIALGGITGHSCGAHLHFEFRFLGDAINPAEVIYLDGLSLKDNKFVYIKNKYENQCNFEMSSLKNSKS